MYDVAVVGAGAAGLTAAIFAARSGARVIALDGAKRIGAKILISGGGRCNVTHDVVTPDDFNGNRNAIAKILRSFTVEETTAWFASMGVTLKREETGKLFPTTDRARTVVDALIAAVAEAGVEVRTGFRVESLGLGPRSSVLGSPAQFEVRGPRPEARGLAAGRVILATGGRSVPKTGSDGHGYEIARSAGHSVTAVFPALVPLVIEGDHWIRRLSGTSAEVELSVLSESGRVIRRERGSMLMTHFGVSGPVVLNISRHWIAARPARLVANFLPDETFESAERMLLRHARGLATVRSLFRVPERILGELAPAKPVAKMSRDERRAVAHALTELEIPVTRDRGFDYAEVTAGGVPLSEIDLVTMESRKRRGLHLCGEILDADGKIGGYNFQWAWASGRLAGLGATNR